MARYIDADKLWNDRPLIPEGKSMDFGAGFSECMWGFSKLIKKQIDNPTDVVPRAEVERLQKALDAYEETSGLKQAKAEVAREIFERLYAHIKYDGHTLSVWESDLICIAKEYDIDLKHYANM